MADLGKQIHGGAQSLLLFQKLLESRDNASPLTLILDSLAQPAKYLLSVFSKKANASKTSVIFISFETFRQPRSVDLFIPAWRFTAANLQAEIRTAIKDPQQRHLIIIDSLHTLASDQALNLSNYLSSLLSPTTSLVAVYHTDQPLASNFPSPYTPNPLTLLNYLATTILTTHSLAHVLKQKAARERSLPAPLFGLGLAGAGESEGPGILQGLESNDARGTVVEMEYRRRSGRVVHGLYFVPRLAHPENKHSGTGRAFSWIMLLDQHPEFQSKQSGGNDGEESQMPETSFKLGLTERQRRDREGVVLPYFDAQREGDIGEGGRILYEMGREDDFDEEEDEI